MKEYRQRKQDSLLSKQKNKQYMKEYRQRKRASDSFQTPIQSPEFKQKRKQYMKEYREQRHFCCEPLQILIAKFSGLLRKVPCTFVLVTNYGISTVSFLLQHLNRIIPVSKKAFK